MQPGTDEQAQKFIEQKFPAYKPWTEAIFKPNSNMETILFAVQSLLGFLLLTFCLYQLGILKKGRRS